MFTNHVGHFMLVTGLLESLSGDGRVVVTSSELHTLAPKEGIQFVNLSGEKKYQAWRAYGHSKFAKILFAKELSRRFQGTGKTANALHPGVIRTNLIRHGNVLMRVIYAVVDPLVPKTIPQGATTQVYVARHPSVATVSGACFAGLQRGRDATGRQRRRVGGSVVGSDGEDCGRDCVTRSTYVCPGKQEWS